MLYDLTIATTTVEFKSVRALRPKLIEFLKICQKTFCLIDIRKPFHMALKMMFGVNSQRGH